MRRVIIAVAAAVAVAVAITGGALAYASIPDANGVIHGCYTVKGGALRVIDTAKGQKVGHVLSSKLGSDVTIKANDGALPPMKFVSLTVKIGSLVLRYE